MRSGNRNKEEGVFKGEQLAGIRRGIWIETRGVSSLSHLEELLEVWNPVRAGSELIKHFGLLKAKEFRRRATKSKEKGSMAVSQVMKIMCLSSEGY